MTAKVPKLDTYVAIVRALVIHSCNSLDVLFDNLLSVNLCKKPCSGSLANMSGPMSKPESDLIGFTVFISFGYLLMRM